MSASNNSDDGQGAFKCTLPDNWRQGRSAYGGIMSGLSLKAARHRYDDLPQLRSATINFIGPVVSDPVFTPRILRQGRHVTFVEVLAHADEKLVASTIFIFGADRDTEIIASHDAAPASPPEEVQDFAPSQFASLLPVFFSNFEVKFIDGLRPMSGADDGYMRVWARHRDEQSRTGEASCLTLGDVLPPAALPMFKKMAPVSSINWMVNMINEPKTFEGWYQVESRLTAARDGYSSQVMRIWNYEGTLIADGMQSVAIFM